VRSTKQLTLSAILSLTGSVFATASAFLGISLLVYSHFLGGGLQHFDDPLFMKIFDWGKLLAQIAIVLGISGLWRPSVLRWHAPACAVATWMFWLITGAD
jgi:hypothetical protein